MLSRILLVDHQRDLRKSLSRWLEDKFPFTQVIEAGSKHEAIDLAQKNSPNVVVMDSHTSRVDDLRAAVPTAPFVILTNHEDDDDDYYNTLTASVCVSKNTLTDLQPTLAALLAN
jgi:DNA-binding NarL/FixJ family response regulator